MDCLRVASTTYVNQCCRKGGAGGRSPPTLQIFLEIRAYRNHYSVVKAILD